MEEVLNYGAQDWEWLEELIAGGPGFTVRIFYSVLILVVIWFLRWAVGRVIHRRIEDGAMRYWWNKFINYASFFLSLFSLIALWFRGFEGFLTFLGLFSAGVAISLRDLIVNIVGWIFILLRKPFRMGDRIELDDVAGDVIDIRLFQFSVMEVGNWVDADQSTGRVVHIPNGRVFSSSVANFSAGFEYIWNEIPVLLTFESDWRRAKRLLGDIADRRAAHLGESARERIRQASRKFLIYYKNLTPIVYTRVKGSGVLLTVRYLCEPRRRRSTEEEIWEDILQTFAEEERIEFAYPTQRFYNRRLEKRTGSGAHGGPAQSGQPEHSE